MLPWFSWDAQYSASSWSANCLTSSINSMHSNKKTMIVHAYALYGYLCSQWFRACKTVHKATSQQPPNRSSTFPVHFWCPERCRKLCVTYILDSTNSEPLTSLRCRNLGRRAQTSTFLVSRAMPEALSYLCRCLPKFWASNSCSV